jgi:hypothetical protein
VLERDVLAPRLGRVLERDVLLRRAFSIWQETTARSVRMRWPWGGFPAMGGATAAGAEIDLVIELPDKERWAGDQALFNRPSSARPENDFYIASDDIKTTRASSCMRARMPTL